MNWREDLLADVTSVLVGVAERTVTVHDGCAAVMKMVDEAVKPLVALRDERRARFAEVAMRRLLNAYSPGTLEKGSKTMEFVRRTSFLVADEMVDEMSKPKHPPATPWDKGR